MGVRSWEHLLDKWIDNITPGKSKRIKMMPALRLANWNVRTMHTGLTDNLQSIDNAHKTTVIDMELDRLNTDIACLQETRLADSGSLKEQRYTFFWQGKSPEEKLERGVGFAVQNTLLTMIEPPTNGSECILTQAGPVNLMSIYAPTLCSTP